MDINLQATLISAGAALFGSIIGVLGTLLGIWLNKKMQSSGKISLYARVVYSESAMNRLGASMKVRRTRDCLCIYQYGLI